jgi:hypothetical protein
MASPSSRPDVPTSTLPAPQPTHPVAGRTVSDAAPTFQWIAVPETTTVRLQLAASDAFDTLYYDEVVDGPTAVALDEVLPDGAQRVVWRVRAETDAPTPWSMAATFALESEVDDPLATPDEDPTFLVDAPPVPIHPISGDVIEADGGTLSWEGVPEASGYRVQVASTEAVDDPIVDVTLDRTTDLTLFDDLPVDQASLFWRVQALFPNDTDGPWSETVRFETDSDLAPAADPADAASPSESAGRSPEETALAGGPAREAHTSNAMAVAFIGVLLVSFLLTILLTMIA